MSRDFASFMASIAGDSSGKRITELMEVLDKVTQIIINSVDSLQDRLNRIEGNIQGMLQKVQTLETTTFAAAPAYGTPGPNVPAMAAPPPPKPEPKPMSPVSSRTALQSELKDLFARRKKE